MTGWLRTAEDGAVPSSAAKRSLANQGSGKGSRTGEMAHQHIRTAALARLLVRRRQRRQEHPEKQASEKPSDAESFKAAMEDDIRAGRYRCDPNAGHHLFRVVVIEWPPIQS